MKHILFKVIAERLRFKKELVYNSGGTFERELSRAKEEIYESLADMFDELADLPDQQILDEFQNMDK